MAEKVKRQCSKLHSTSRKRQTKLSYSLSQQEQRQNKDGRTASIKENSYGLKTRSEKQSTTSAKENDPNEKLTKQLVLNVETTTKQSSDLEEHSNKPKLSYISDTVGVPERSEDILVAEEVLPQDDDKCDEISIADFRDSHTSPVCPQVKQSLETHIGRQAGSVDCRPAINLGSNSTKHEVFTCPLCWKKFDKSLVQISHIKLCAAKHKMTTQQVLGAMELHKKQTAERQAFGLPVVLPAVPGSSRAKKLDVTPRVQDPNMQLALALSESLKHAQEQEEAVLISAGIHEDIHKQETLLERFGFTSTKPVIRVMHPRTRAGKHGASLLLKRTHEDRERIITEKVSSILMCEDDNSSTAVTNACKSCCAFEIHSTILLEYFSVENKLWNLSSEPLSNGNREQYYVESLVKYFPPSQVAVYSMVKGDHTPVTPTMNILEDPDKETEANDFDNESCVSRLVNPGLDECMKESVITERQSAFCRNNSSTNCVTEISVPQCSALDNSLDSFVEDWRKMVNSKTMSDLKIYVQGGQVLFAHKLVIYTRCPTMVEDFVKLDYPDSDSVTEIIEWRNVSYETAFKLLEFLYCGTVKNIINADISLCSLARRYKLNQLELHLHNIGRKSYSSAAHTTKIESPTWLIHDRNMLGSVAITCDKNAAHSVDKNRTSPDMFADSLGNKTDGDDCASQDSDNTVAHLLSIINKCSPTGTQQFPVQNDSNLTIPTSEPKLLHRKRRLSESTTTTSTTTTMDSGAIKKHCATHHNTAVLPGREDVETIFLQDVADEDQKSNHDPKQVHTQGVEDRIGNNSLTLNVSSTDSVITCESGEDDILHCKISNEVKDKSCGKNFGAALTGYVSNVWDDFDCGDTDFYHHNYSPSRSDTDLHAQPHSVDNEPVATTSGNYEINIHTETYNSVQTSKIIPDATRDKKYFVGNGEPEDTNNVSPSKRLPICLDSPVHHTPPPKTSTPMNSSVRALLEDSFVEQLNSSRLWRELHPACSTSDTPDERIVFDKSADITPIADYSAMETQQLKKELYKYGLKPLKRKQAKKILKHIYDELHPEIEVPSVPESVASKSSSPECERVSPCSEDKTSLQDACELLDESSCSSSSSSSCIANDWLMEEDAPLSQEGGDVAEGECLGAAVKNFINSDSDQLQRVLLYKPVWLEEMHMHLKNNGLKFSVNQLADYLDQECIIYRTKKSQSQKNRRRENKEKLSPKKNSPKKNSSKKNSPKKNSPKKNSPKKNSPKKNSPKKSSSEKT